MLYIIHIPTGLFTTFPKDVTPAIADEILNDADFYFTIPPVNSSIKPILSYTWYRFDTSKDINRFREYIPKYELELVEYSNV